MLDRFLAGVIRLVRERRLALIRLVVLLTVVSALALRKLEADPSPRALLASADLDQEQISNDFRTRFGSTDNMLAILIEAPKDVIAPAPLGYMHALGEAVAKMPHIERVESLARTAFPQKGPNPKDEELSLEGMLEESPDACQGRSEPHAGPVRRGRSSTGTSSRSGWLP